MKECKYCGTQYEDSLKFCPSCGANAVVTARERDEAEKLYQKEQENQRRSIEAPRNQIKKLILIIALAVVAIVAVIVIISLISSNTPVNGGLSRSNMAEAYEHGLDYFNNKDYISAIAELKKVSKESSRYEDAIALLQKANDAYCDDAISKASALADKGDYEGACAAIEQALGTVQDNEKLSEQLLKLKNDWVSDILALAARYASNSDYEAAYSAIEEAPETVRDDSRLSEQLGTYQYDWATLLLTQAAQYADGDNYESACSVIESAPEKVKNDSRLSERLNTYKSEWATIILDQAAKYADEGDYKTAISIIESGIKSLPNSSELSLQLTAYKEADRAQIKAKTLADSSAYVKKGNYPEAIKTIKSSLIELGSDAELSSLLEKYQNEYRTLIIEQADTALKSDGYEAAIAKAKEGLAVLTNDAQLLSAIENYETYAPVWLTDLDYFSGSENPDYIQSQKDNMGNLHFNCYTRYFNRVYAINGRYTRITGSMYQSYEGRSQSAYSMGESIYLEIYGDGSILFSEYIEKGATGLDPIDFEADISNINKLEIKFHGYAEAWGPFVSLGDIKLYP